jgi:hypothetical protein
MSPALVISDGGVASLLACAAVSESRGGAVWVPVADPDTHLLRKAAEQAANLYGLSVLSGPTMVGGAEAEWMCRVLLEGCFLARGAGLSAVVWPVSAGAELVLEPVAAAADRALLAGRLASIGDPRPVEVRAPYVDYTDRQLADLILDMDLPIWTCWWYAAAGNPAAERERAYWAGLLREAGWTGELPGPDLAVRGLAEQGRPVTPPPGD